MPRRPGDTTPDPPGGGAAERLREFIDQRFPDDEAPPESIPEHVADSESRGAQSETSQGEARLAQLEHTVRQLVEAQRRHEARLEELAAGQRRLEVLLRESNNEQ